MDREAKHKEIDRGTHKTCQTAQKIAVIDTKLYTGELFLETSPKLKDAFKTYLDSGYRQLYLTEMLKGTDREIDFLQKCERYTYNVRSTLCIFFLSVK